MFQIIYFFRFPPIVVPIAQFHWVKIVKDDEESDTEQTKSLLEDYRRELVEIKVQPATPAITIIDKNIVEAAVTTVIEKVLPMTMPD